MSSKSYHHGDLRNSLIEQGIKLISQEGLKQFSLRRLATLCGVSQAAPYSHFKGKEDLVEAMQDYVTEQFMEVLEKTLQSCADQNDPYAIIQLGKAYIMFFVKNPQYFSFLFSSSNIEVNLSLDSSSTKNFPPFEFMKKVVLRIFGESGMTKQKMEDLIIALWATVHGLTSIITMKNVRYDKDWETKIEDIIWNK